MRCSSALLLCVVIVSLAGSPADPENYAELGYSEDTVNTGDQSDQCVGVQVYNHDYSFENGYCWQLDGAAPPYYGAFAEAFDVGPAVVECGLYWFTDIGYMPTVIVDVYLWQGGVTTPPGDVLFVRPEVNLGAVGFWPQCTLTEATIECCVDGEFTVGYWADFCWDECLWYVCVDENGSGGNPWTHIAPGLGYPTGWNHPNVVFPDCVSMGIAATITEEPSPARSKTWGEIKALF